MSALRGVLEQACAEARCSKTSLTVLAPQNDPFRIDTPASHPELRFRGHRVALIPDQVRLHGLPSTRLKDTERRADKWREKTGIEQTGVDALAALRPAVLRRMARDAIRPSFDTTLAHRCAGAQADWARACREAVAAQTDQEHLEDVAEQADRIIKAAREQLKKLAGEVRIAPDDYDLPDRPDLPEPELLAEPDGPPLIDSDWPWPEQSRRLKASKAYDGNSEP